jgi:hypothetical protein
MFFLLFGLGSCFGWETGYAINIARDFGPRLMSYAVGYGSEVWSAGGYYLWVSRHFTLLKGRVVDTTPDTDGRPFPGLCFWRAVVRCLHLYRTQSYQYAMDGAEALFSFLRAESEEGTCKERKGRWDRVNLFEYTTS